MKISKMRFKLLVLVLRLAGLLCRKYNHSIECRLFTKDGHIYWKYRISDYGSPSKVTYVPLELDKDPGESVYNNEHNEHNEHDSDYDEDGKPRFERRRLIEDDFWGSR